MSQITIAQGIFQKTSKCISTLAIDFLSST